ncbi:MAG: YhfC family intramembrane metalloprotease [Chloroflexales bacterium]|nr:YhfC family intramembrane metalloprotease [Chloroflexales bacterium]
MTPALQLSNGFIIGSVIAIAFMIMFPLALAVLARRKLGVGWRYFGFGALVFFVSQMLIRIPLIIALQMALAPQLSGSRGLQIAFGGLLALTAGLFESVGRYLGYRWLMRNDEKTWSKGVMYGLGHGGIEAMLLVAGLALANLIALLTMSAVQFEALPLDAREALLEATQLPIWVVFAGAWERIWAISFHAAMSLVVLQVFRRGSMRWLLYAILLHALFDFIAPVLVPQLGLDLTSRILLQEGLIMLIGLCGIWIIWALRDRPNDQPRSEATPTGQIVS